MSGLVHNMAYMRLPTAEDKEFLSFALSQKESLDADYLIDIFQL